jgi:fluoroacetyl-CoA thioesterase
MTLEPGLEAAFRYTLAEADTAAAVGSGDVPVLATPRLLALAEAATVAAISPHLPQGVTSVGTSASLEHRRASPIGAELVVEAELTEIDGRRLVFSFIARESGHQTGAPDDDGGDDRVVGAGTVERVLVDRQAFLARAAGGHRP